MDYPFYLQQLTQLPWDLLQECLALLDENKAIEHPHFVSKEKNKDAYRLRDENIAKIVKLVTEHVDYVIPKTNIFWHEINMLKPGGLLGEHSDMAYAGYNRKDGFPMEVILTHKLHVHFTGESILSFRRSKFEPQTEFRPKPGQIFWYNNYVWHESKNPSETENRIAMSLIYYDKKWLIRQALYERNGYKFNDCYQLT
jgi:hypothetical protein